MDASGPESSAGQTEALLLHYLYILRKRRMVVGAFAGFLLVTVAIATALSTPFYAATAQIQISPKAPAVMELDEVSEVVSASSTQEIRNYYATQYKIIQSRSVLTRALESLRAEHQVVDFDEAEKPVEAFRKLLSVDPVPETHLVNITFEYSDPEKARLFADTLAEAYIDANHDRARESAQKALAWLKEQADRYKQKKHESASDLLTYRTQHGLIGVNDTFSASQDRLEKLWTRWTEVATERIQAEAAYGELAMLAQRPDWGPMAQQLSVGRPVLTDLLTQYDRLKVERADLSGRYLEGMPEMQDNLKKMMAIEAQIKLQMDNIIKGKRAELDQLRASEGALKTDLDKARAEVEKVEARRIDQKFLEAETARDEAFYQNLSQRLDEVDLTLLLQNNNIVIIDRAVTPTDPVRPVMAVNLAMALVLGLLGGCLSALLLEHFDVTVKSQEDIERVIGVPMLGVVPEVDPEDLKTLASDVERNLYVHARPRSQVAEHLRSVRTNVMFRTAAVKGTRTLLITSASPREGKSFTSCNLAAIIAMTGHRVLLIDADLRRPAVHKRFGLDNVEGLEAVLRGERAPADVVRHTHIRNLDVIVAGPPPQNPGELLGGEAMVSLVRGFTDYDVVLVDTPPVNVVADPLLLASAVDGVLVVVEANRTDRNLVAQASVRLREMKANVLGAIINKLSSKGSSSYSYGYGYNYYYNTYGYYYAEDEEDPEKAPARVG